VRAVLGTSLVVAFATTVMSASPASAAPVEVGVWHFDEPSGSTIAVDSSGAGNNGLIWGNVVVGQPGFQNTAYLFDGGWVEVANSTTLNPGAGDFSASAMVKLIRLPRSGETFDIIRKGTAGVKGGEFKLEIAPAGRVRCVAQGISPSGTRVTARALTTKVNLADGQWHSVSCTRTGSTWTARADGVTKAVTADLGSINNVKAVAIGAKYGKEDFTRGLIDELRLVITGP
jgi:hypothetical protein